MAVGTLPCEWCVMLDAVAGMCRFCFLMYGSWWLQYSKSQLNTGFLLSCSLVRHDYCKGLLRMQNYLCWWGGRLYCIKHINKTQPFVHLPIPCFIGCHCRHLTWQGPLEGQMYHKAYILQHLGVIPQSLQVALGNLHQDNSPLMEGILHLEEIHHQECHLTQDTQVALCQASPHHHLVSSLWAIQDNHQQLTQGSSLCQIIHQAQAWILLCPLTQELQGLQSLL